MVEKLYFFFPLLSNYHDEKKVCVYIYIYKFLLIEYTKFNYLKKEKKAIWHCLYIYIYIYIKGSLPFGSLDPLVKGYINKEHFLINSLIHFVTDD